VEIFAPEAALALAAKNLRFTFKKAWHAVGLRPFTHTPICLPGQF